MESGHRVNVNSGESEHAIVIWGRPKKSNPHRIRRWAIRARVPHDRFQKSTMYRLDFKQSIYRVDLGYVCRPDRFKPPCSSTARTLTGEAGSPPHYVRPVGFSEGNWVQRCPLLAPSHQLLPAPRYLLNTLSHLRKRVAARRVAETVIGAPSVGTLQMCRPVVDRSSVSFPIDERLANELDELV